MISYVQKADVYLTKVVVIFISRHVKFSYLLIYAEQEITTTVDNSQNTKLYVGKQLIILF